MTIEDIQKLAKAHATLIMNYTSITQAEAMQLVSTILANVMGVGTQLDMVSPSTPVETSHANDPGSGAVLAREGYTCYCSLCKVDHYVLTTNIMGQGMGVNAFVGAFKPLGSAPTITRDHLDVLKDKDGNTSIDCPVCKGEKTLMIIGKTTKAIDAKVDEAPEVGSIQGET